MTGNHKHLKCIVLFSVILIFLTSSGCVEKSKTFVRPNNEENYITFHEDTGRVFIHFESLGVTYQGDFKETDTDYVITEDVSEEQTTFKKFPDGSIRLAPECLVLFYPE